MNTKTVTRHKKINSTIAIFFGLFVFYLIANRFRN